MNKPLLFALLFILPYLILAKTNFHFNALFQCDLPEPNQRWCVKQMILKSGKEMDVFLVGPEKGCTNDNEFKISMEYELESGVEHEFLTSIHHNCSDDGGMWLYEPEIGTYKGKENMEFDVNYTLNLTNQNSGFGSIDDKW